MALALGFAAALEAAPAFRVTHAAKEALDGRLLLLLSTDPKEEPRLQINDGPGSQIVFGVDVENWKPGTAAAIRNEFGYPVRTLGELKPGKYRVQALLHKYETFRRADGHVVKLPMDRGEGQQWNRAPGNLYSAPREIEVSATSKHEIALDQVIPPIPEPKDTKYIKHVKIQSELLTKFWGRPMHLGAHILVPEGSTSIPRPGIRW